ncbi:MAG: Orn/DAP/Arg decarboxylase 2 [Monoraphidium minutum]|nr:MAG: Orn/DAP/Arg decarboxylase 2 [Monoraphidium minutum]
MTVGPGDAAPLARLRALQAYAHPRRAAALSAAIGQPGLLDGDALDFTPTAMLMDVDMIRATADHLRRGAGFPPGALHTVAVKANPVGGVLRLFLDAGFGAEVASLGELAQALHVGFPPGRVVFDSPCKTRAELAFALERGVAVNLDNFQELERAKRLIAAHPEWLAREGGLSIGLRVNPQVGEGAIAALSTAGATSKFGFPLAECRAELVTAFVDCPWLNMLHLHVGSQGLPTSLIVEGAARVWGLLEEVDAACGGRRVRMLDIGGGLSVDFTTDTPGPYTLPAPPAAAQGSVESGAASSGGQQQQQQQQQQPAVAVEGEGGPPVWTRFQEQAALLRAAVPGLFDESRGVRMVTENGRLLLAKAGCVVSRVEYTKSSGGRRIAVCHTGADLLMRTCYMPDTWGLRVRICGPDGAPKEAACAAGGGGGGGADGGGGEGAVELEVQDVAGPLCFQGDRVATAALLPRAEVGDWVVVLDAGAYTLSMASRYNSRCSPAVYGFEGGPGAGAGGGGGGGGGGGAQGGGGAAAGGAETAGGGGGGVRLSKLRGRETLQQVLDYWNIE